MSNQLSPRQAAIRAGEKWYVPLTPCPRCHTYAQRRVDNGECKGCQTSQFTLSSDIMDKMPDTILTHNDARELGFNVYRTGKPCKNGHNGWRYVSTRRCVTCRRNER